MSALILDCEFSEKKKSVWNEKKKELKEVIKGTEKDLVSASQCLHYVK